MREKTVRRAWITGFVLVALAITGVAASKKKGSEAAAPAMTVPSDAVWVSRPDGGKSCEPTGAQAIEAGAAELGKVQVKVLDSRKGSDGKMRAQMCGMPTGKLNSYLIPRQDLERAVALGFMESAKAEASK